MAPMEITHHCNSVRPSVVCESVCLSVNMSACLALRCVRPHLCLYFCQYLSGSLVMNLPPVCMSAMCPSLVYLSSSVCLSAYLSDWIHALPLHFYLSACPHVLVCLSMCLSVCFSHKEEHLQWI